jgi:raffinose/stachyose/melibiose transport system permease protein
MMARDQSFAHPLSQPTAQSFSQSSAARVSGYRVSFYSLFEGISYFILLAATLMALFPIGMAIMNSLKTDGEIMNNILAFPAVIQFSNYKQAFELTHFLRSMMNTIVVISTGLAGIVFFGAMSGYKLSRTRSRLSGFLFGMFIMSMLIPFHSIMITLTRVARLVHVQGSSVGLGLIYIGLGVPMAIFLYHGFIKSVPRELDEAALIDGCGEFRFFLTIVFPLVAPITVTVIILNTLWMWNDFLLPLIMITDSDNYTVMLSTNILFGQYSNNDWSAILATLVLAMLPMVSLYLFLQKYIMKGITEGALKG